MLGEHTDGTYAELVAVPARNLHPLPEGLSFEEAAAFPLTFETAYRMLVTRAGLREGEWVLVSGPGSGVGTAALQLAKALGARVLAASSSPAKLERARELGADATVLHTEQDVVGVAREATGGRGVDVVVEHVGAATWARSLAAAAPRGRIAVCGATSGPNPPASLHRVWWKQLSILGSTMGAPARLPCRPRPGRERPRAACRRQRVPARGSGERRARADGERRPLRQDHPQDFGLTLGSETGPGNPPEILIGEGPALGRPFRCCGWRGSSAVGAEVLPPIACGDGSPYRLQP